MKRPFCSFTHTKRACYIGYIVQAIVNTFVPLLFVTFNTSLGITLEKLTLISSFNFAVQLTVDLLAARFADRIGYRRLIVSAQFCSAAGLIGYGILPYLFDPFAGLLLAAFFCAVGGGLIEVLISPVIEACPTERKSANMSFLHSFFCWGQAGVILLSTLFFSLAGIRHWQILTAVWAVIPLTDAFLFLQVPINRVAEKEDVMPPRRLLSSGSFLLLILLMICAGASEVAMSLWASAFAEVGLGISKSAGDLAGPFVFAILMGICRVFYSLTSERIRLLSFMSVSSAVCLIGYLLAALAPYPALSLTGCALVGLSVGILWPGTLSLAARLCPAGGTFMYGILALAGDLGCIAGTALVGFLSGFFRDDLHKGLLFASLFPILLVVGLAVCSRKSRLAGILV